MAATCKAHARLQEMLLPLTATLTVCPLTQAVAVADSTVAFSRWAFGSAEGALPEEAAAEPMAGLEPATGKIALRSAICLESMHGRASGRLAGTNNTPLAHCKTTLLPLTDNSSCSTWVMFTHRDV